MKKMMILAAALFQMAVLAASLQPAHAMTTGNTVYLPIYSHVYHGNIDWTKKPVTCPHRAIQWLC